MRRAAFLAALLAAGCGGGDDDDSGNYYAWSTLDPLPGGARQETAVVVVDFDNIYVLGGFDDSITVVDDVTRIDISVAIAPLPVPMHHANAGVANGKIWVLGFLTGVDFAADGRVFSYDPATDVWTEGPSMPLGTERGASGVAYDRDIGEIYVIGGLRDGAAVADVSRFTPALTGTGGTWTGLTDLPAPRDHLVAGIIDGAVFAAGGRNTIITSHVPELLEFDPSGAGSWLSRAPMPTSRGGAAGSVMGGRLYVIGGEGNPADPNGVFPDVEAYDPARDEWEKMPPMLTPRHGTGAATRSGEDIRDLVVPGGADHQAFGAVDTVESLAYHCLECPGE